MNLPPPSFTFDRIGLTSMVPARELRKKLPMRLLRNRCHDFQINALPSRPGPYKSRVEFTYSTDLGFWDLLLNVENEIGTYVITKLELAFDFPANNITDAKNITLVLGQHIRKLWHCRKEVKVEWSRNIPAPPGIINGPTFYFEDRKSTTNVKAYARYAKEPKQKSFNYDRPIARLEWTLTGALAIKTKTGIENLSDLAVFCSDIFLSRHFRLENFDPRKFGELVATPPKKRIWPRSRRSKYSYDRPARAAYAYLRFHAYKDSEWSNSFEVNEASLLKWNSTAHIRGHLRQKRHDLSHTPGRKSELQNKMKDLTDYQIDRIFGDCTPKFREWE